VGGEAQSLAFFDPSGVLHLYIESSSWPNFDGIDNKRIITSLSDDELKWYSPAGSVGTTAEVVWKRAK